MTAWNQLVGALIVTGYSEQQAVDMVYDVLHEEAERIRSEAETLKRTSPAHDPLIHEGMLKAAAELDPEDPNWEARCRTCQLPWSKDHVCHIAWYSWTQTNKKAIVDFFAQAVAMVDARVWNTRTPNEDDPLWTKYTTYGVSCWEQMLEAIRSNAKKDQQRNS